jgi:fructose-1,6-bisphosphatase/inositol monophosphatase family enzyme
VAAAIALVEESGGKITDWQGQPATIQSREIAAGNEALHHEFLKLIQGQAQLRFKGV